MGPGKTFKIFPFIFIFEATSAFIWNKACINLDAVRLKAKEYNDAEDEASD